METGEHSIHASNRSISLATDTVHVFSLQGRMQEDPRHEHSILDDILDEQPAQALLRAAKLRRYVLAATHK